MGVVQESKAVTIAAAALKRIRNLDDIFTALKRNPHSRNQFRPVTIPRALNTEALAHLASHKRIPVTQCQCLFVDHRAAVVLSLEF
jgi:hypothetical protein